MGSFNVNCSITERTIGSDDEIVVQFLLPNRFSKGEADGSPLMQVMINNFKEKGLEEGIKIWEKQVKKWNSALTGKRVIIQETTSKWVPFGPAIRYKYDDSAEATPIDDPENNVRIRLLEQMLCTNIKAIFESAVDDRWWTYGIKEDDPNWKIDGLTGDLPTIDVLKKLGMTFMLASAYGELTKYNFTRENSGWELEDKMELIDMSINSFSEFLDENERYHIGGDKAAGGEIRTLVLNCGHIKDLSPVNSGLLWVGHHKMKESGKPVDTSWFKEQCNYVYGMMALAKTINQSNYAGQSRNHYAWNRLNRAVSKK
jgi:hypothetical protein